MTMRTLALLLLSLIPCAAALAGPQPLSDGELADVRGRDGISFAVDLQLNQSSTGTPGGTQLKIGQVVDGRTTYLVMDNISGRVQILALGIGTDTAADGTNYVAVTMPSYVRFTNVGVDAISAQSSTGVTDSLGRVTLNGDLSMQGQLRMWSH